MLRGRSSIEAEHARVHVTLAATTTVCLSSRNDALNGNDSLNLMVFTFTRRPIWRVDENTAIINHVEQKRQSRIVRKE